MNVTNSKDGQFCIKVDFVKNSEDPSRVFRAMSSLIDTLARFDHDLAVSVDSSVDTVLLLENVESGSIRTWLVSSLRSVDDESLKSGEIKKLVGSYLSKGKWLLINRLENKINISNNAEIEEIRTGLLDLAIETGIRNLPAYAPIDRTRLLKTIEEITVSLSNLSDGDTATYEANNLRAQFNLKFRYAADQIEELITRESIESSAEMILKVKKPDYLGESMWEFRHGRTPIEARILDVGWLDTFQRREVVVRPGDSLRVRMMTRLAYDYDNNLVSTKCEILKVLEVLGADNSKQIDVFE